jgi:hypothetical protein
LGVVPHRSSIADYYALTHSIFFLSDFGSTSLTNYLPDGIEPVVTWLELGALRFLFEKNLDIVAEIIWCLLMLGCCSGPIAALCLVTIAEEINATGFLRGPSTTSSPNVSEEDSSTYANYHSTLLAAAIFSSGAIEVLRLSAEKGDFSASMTLSQLHAIGGMLCRCAYSHSLARYELEKELRKEFSSVPYLSSKRFVTLFPN